jgi:plasmid stabilization system protein ParE
MVRPARLAGPAQRWLAAELKYLAERNPAAAFTLLDRIEAARIRLAEYPETGPKTPVERVRRLVIAPYVLTYRRAGNEIQIVSIRHGRQSDPSDPPRTSSPIAEET